MDQRNVSWDLQQILEEVAQDTFTINFWLFLDPAFFSLVYIS
jgi:hypothetical protein